MDIKLSRKAMIRDLSINKILIMIAKIIGAISLSSLIYSFCKNISIADVKIAIAFLEAKFFGLLDSDYKITYTSKYGFKLEKEIQYFFNDSYVSEVLAKYKFALYEGLLLVLLMLLMIFTLLGHLWFEIRSIIENKIYRTSETNQSITKSNTSSHDNIKPSSTIYPLEKKVLSKRKDKTPKDFQDI